MGYHKNVFINCPFDTEYISLLRPMLFTIVYLGYNPRIARERSDSGEIRVQKILELIRESRYSIHDLSRLKSIASDEYYRMNMPFELGMDYSSKQFNPDLQDKKYLILETDDFEYMKALSDISGMDIKSHGDDPEQMIHCIRSWFSETVGLKKIRSSLEIWYHFMDFNTSLFKEKLIDYAQDYSMTKAEILAKDSISRMSIPEYIDEIKERY